MNRMPGLYPRASLDGQISAAATRTRSTKIIMTQSDVVSSDFSRLIYEFSSDFALRKNSRMRLLQCSLYFSWFNITAKFGNNQIQYTWVDASVETITFPDGLYSIEDIAAYIREYMHARTHYTLNGGESVYYFELVPNQVYQKTTLTLNPIPSSGVTLPPGATWSLPSSDTVMQMTINNKGLGVIIGFPLGSYPSVSQSVMYQVNSPNVPQISPTTTVLVNCNMIGNTSLQPRHQNVLYAFSPTVDRGQLQVVEPQTVQWEEVMPADYRRMEIYFTDQRGVALQINDPEIFVMVQVENVE